MTFPREAKRRPLEHASSDKCDRNTTIHWTMEDLVGSDVVARTAFNFFYSVADERYLPGILFFYSAINSREVNEARLPHTCSRPCAFEEKKHTKSRRTQNIPA